MAIENIPLQFSFKPSILLQETIWPVHPVGLWQQTEWLGLVMDLRLGFETMSLGQLLESCQSAHVALAKG
jgi:hypothetical protein